MPKSYRELEVWQRAMDFAEQVYGAKRGFPPEERYGIGSQLGRAAVCIPVCIPANIAEGAERNGTKEFLQFLGVAQGSLAEAETLILLAARLGYIPPEATEDLLCQSAQIGKMMHGLRRSLNRKLAPDHQPPTPDHQPPATNHHHARRPPPPAQVP